VSGPERQGMEQFSVFFGCLFLKYIQAASVKKLRKVTKDRVSGGIARENRMISDFDVKNNTTGSG
jgi:hypothetical protein